jgi:hypothetical protein
MSSLPPSPTVIPPGLVGVLLVPIGSSCSTESAIAALRIESSRWELVAVSRYPFAGLSPY